MVAFKIQKNKGSLTATLLIDANSLVAGLKKLNTAILFSFLREASYLTICSLLNALQVTMGDIYGQTGVMGG